MIKVLLKYKILEHCINIIFDNISKSFISNNHIVLFGDDITNNNVGQQVTIITPSGCKETGVIVLANTITNLVFHSGIKDYLIDLDHLGLFIGCIHPRDMILIER